jgi:hypothetical protein
LRLTQLDPIAQSAWRAIVSPNFRHTEVTVRFATTRSTVHRPATPDRRRLGGVTKRRLSRALKATGNLTARLSAPLHGWPAQRTEAHSRNVDNRCWAERTHSSLAALHRFAHDPELVIRTPHPRMIGRQKGVVLDDQVVLVCSSISLSDPNPK